MKRSKRIVFATFGSLGDLHPYIAIAEALRRRGHRPLIVTTDMHREAVEDRGIDFAPVRPGEAQMGDQVELVRKLFHPTRGPKYLIHDLVMPHIRSAYEDLDRACAGADLLVTHPLAFTGRLIVEKRGLPWRSTVLSPLSLMSAVDPPLFGPAPWLLWIRKLGVAPYRAAFAVAKRIAGAWEKPLRELRADLGLPPAASYAQFEGQYAPSGNLALYSHVLGHPQPDWPPNTTLCGFSRHDTEPGPADHGRELDDFLDAGPAPVVFTLGSAVSMYESAFFTDAIQAARRLGGRALLVTGQEPGQYDAAIAAAGMPAGAVKAFRYLPYSAVFARAAVNVHQGGIGTLAQALVAGKPQLIAPVGFDQPDNARRASRLGLCRSIPFRKLTVENMTAALGELTSGARYAEAAAAVARTVIAEEREQRAAALLADAP